ncbi:MAG: hypothetical protein PHE78_03130 [Candidatus Gastranaerophilales bacterium]|nr:hypothetical protein [Candidatus Gastranaerophilales bacterium]
MGYGINNSNNPYENSFLQPLKPAALKVDAPKIPDKLPTIEPQSTPIEPAKKKNGPFGAIGNMLGGNPLNQAIKAAGQSVPVDNMQKINDATGNGGMNAVVDANQSAGNYLGANQGKSSEKVKPTLNMSIDSKGNPLVVQNSPDGGTSKMVKTDNSINYEATDANGKKTTMDIVHNEDKTFKATSNVVNKDNSSETREFKYDANGKVTEGTTTQKDAQGNIIGSSVQSRDEKGNILVETKDAQGNTTDKTKYDDNGKALEAFNPETGKFEKVKEEHREGSLGDIKDKKQAMVDNVAGKIKKNEKVQAQYNEQKAKIEAKYADNPKKKEKALAKFETKFDNKVNEMAAKKVKGTDEFKELSKQEAAEQEKVDQYKDVNLTVKDKNGKERKLTAEEISDRKDLFDEDGKALDKKALEEKGVKKSFSEEAMMNNPKAIMESSDATPEEKNKASLYNMAQMLGIQLPGQQAQPPSQGAVLAQVFTQFAIGMSQQNQGQQNQRFVPASRRLQA